MRWKHERQRYRATAEAYVQHLIEQHERHIFATSCIDEAPGVTLREKLKFLLDEEPVPPRMRRSVRHRRQRIRDDVLERTLRQAERTKQHE